MSAPADAQRHRLPRFNDGLGSLAPYSWRSDPSVPAFDDGRPLIVFDGMCVLCSRFAQFVAARDRSQRIQFTAAQSDLGQGLMRHFGLDPINFETNVLLHEGRAYGKLPAFGRVMREIGGVWRPLGVAARADGAIGDAVYDLIARSRFRLFGHRQTCLRPDASWQKRVIGTIAGSGTQGCHE